MTKHTTVDRLIPAPLMPVTVDLDGAARTAAAFWGDRCRGHLARVALAIRTHRPQVAADYAERAALAATYAGTAARLARS